MKLDNKSYQFKIIDEYIEYLGKIKGYSKNTITSLDKLLLDLNKSRKSGFSINEAETFDYIYGIGSAILDSQGRAIAGISISGTKSTINLKTIPDLSIKVMKTAKQISQRLINN